MSRALKFDDSLQRIKIFYQITGLVDIDTKERSAKQNRIYVFNFAWLSVAVTCAFFWILLGIFREENLTKVTFVAPCVSLTYIGQVKAIFFFLKENKVLELIEKIRELERKKHQYEFDSVEDEEIIEPEIKFLEAVTKVLNILNFLMVVVFDLFPLILIAVKYYRSGDLEPMLPFLDVYPFIDAYDLRIWPFAYVHQIWAECVVLLYICANDYLFFTCCTHIRIHLKILQRQFEKVIPRNFTDTKQNGRVMMEKFKELIKHHQDIIRAANTMEQVYSKSTLYNFIISSVVICLTGFNVTMINDIVSVIISIIFLFMSLLQIYFLCYFGDLLMNSSGEVASAVYNSNWFLSGTTIGKNIIIIHMRSRLPCKLTAAGFADVNLRAFMRILSSSWSYFALLQTIYGSRR